MFFDWCVEDIMVVLVSVDVMFVDWGVYGIMVVLVSVGCDVC